MTDPSVLVQTKAAFMESVQTKSFHRSGQALYESIYSAKPVIFGNEVYTPSTPLPLASSQVAIDGWIIANPGILLKYNNYILTSDAISNGELYYIVDGGTWMNPFILEYMVPDPLSQPSNGYVLQLRQGVGGTNPGQQISPTAGRWWVSPDSGSIHFEVGYTPADLGWGNITITVYVYVGDTVTTTLSPAPGVTTTLYGEGPPHNVLPTGNPQFYIDVKDYTGNSFNFIIWAWVDGESRHFGWRPCWFKWEAFYETNQVPATELYFYDFVKGNPEQAPIVEVVDKGISRPVQHTAPIIEVTDIAIGKPNITTALVSEEFIITHINGPTSIINGSELNSWTLNGVL